MCLLLYSLPWCISSLYNDCSIFLIQYLAEDNLHYSLPRPNNKYTAVSFIIRGKKLFTRALASPSVKRPSNKNLSISPNSTLVFTPVHNQTVLCPAPPYGPSTMKLACCCRGLTRCGHSERGERAVAAPGGPQNTGPFPARGAPPWAAAPSGPWGTRAEQERRDHSPRPSSLCRSSWKWEERSEGWNRLLYQLCFSVKSYEECLGSAWSSSVIF